MTQTTATASAVLKEFYLGPLRETLNNMTFLLSQVEQTSERVEGKEVVLALRLGRNQGIGARAENAALPTAGQQRYGNVRHKMKNNYGAFEVTGQTIKAMASDRGSFTRPVSSEMEGLVSDLKNDLNRQLYGDGTGSLAAVSGAGAGNAVPLTTLTATQKRNLVPGMLVDVVTAAGAAHVTGATVTGVTATQVTLDIAATAAVSGDLIVRSGAAGQEVTGLAKIVSATGALYGLDPVTEPRWASTVYSGVGPITEEAYTQAWQDVNIATGEEVNIIVCDAQTHRYTSRLLQSLKRFPNTNQLRGGYSGLDMDFVGQGTSGPKGCTLRFDKDCQDATAYGITTETLHWDRMSDWEFMEEDGNVLQRALGPAGRRDAYEAVLFLYADLCTHNRAAHFKLAGIAAPTGTFLAAASTMIADEPGADPNAVEDEGDEDAGSKAKAKK